MLLAFFSASASLLITAGTNDNIPTTIAAIAPIILIIVIIERIIFDRFSPTQLIQYSPSEPKSIPGASPFVLSDAINDECLEYLTELNKKTLLTIELGLQTIHEKTSKLINRCHTLEQFDTMVNKLRKRHINVVVHIINGLPYEDEEMMLDTVKHLNNLDIQGIKIHMLHIIKDTPMANLYLRENFHILSKEEYIDIVIKQLEILDPKIIVNRITSDPDKDTLLEPVWLTLKCQLLNDIDKEMKKRNTYQGINL